MKKIGLIGGIGPESTVLYYRKIIDGVLRKAGKKDLPRVCIESLSPFTIFSLCHQKRFDQLTDCVLGAARRLAAGGADIAVCTSNTLNIVMDRVGPLSPIPIVSSMETACDAAQQRGAKKIGLLGTALTMSNTFFKSPFEARGIEVVVPSDAQIARIQSKIEVELELCIFKESTRQEFIAIIEDLRQRAGIDHVAFARTELPVMLGLGYSPVPILETVECHVDALICAAMSD